MKRLLAYAGAISALVTLPSFEAKAQRSNEEYTGCIQRCYNAGLVYGFYPSQYWAGFTACQLACEEYNPEPPSGWGPYRGDAVLTPRSGSSKSGPQARATEG